MSAPSGFAERWRQNAEGERSYGKQIRRVRGAHKMMQKLVSLTGVQSTTCALYRVAAKICSNAPLPKCITATRLNTSPASLSMRGTCNFRYSLSKSDSETGT